MKLEIWMDQGRRWVVTIEGNSAWDVIQAAQRFDLPNYIWKVRAR